MMESKITKIITEDIDDAPTKRQKNMGKIPLSS
jgi:hypothetical protein